MSEESELERSEEASATRLEKAREEGDIPRSRELSTFTLLVVAATGIATFASSFGEALRQAIYKGLTFDKHAAFSPEMPILRLQELVSDVVVSFAPLALILIAAAITGALLVGGWNVSFSHLSPKFLRLNPITGFGNIFSTRSVVELIKALCKATLVGFVGYKVVSSEIPELLSYSHLPIESGISKTYFVLIKGLFLTIGALGFIAIIDVPFQLFNYAKKMRMTKEQVRQESKEENGNPEIKGRIKHQQREIARRRMMSEIPNADVVITNPTHYAVAIKYSESSMRAPRVVAKGLDEVALKIREIARSNQVMILESPKLARALHAHTELGDEIPQSLYLAVAEILAYVFQVNNFDRNHSPYPERPREVHVPDELDPNYVASTKGSVV